MGSTWRYLPLLACVGLALAVLPAAGSELEVTFDTVDSQGVHVAGEVALPDLAWTPAPVTRTLTPTPAVVWGRYQGWQMSGGLGQIQADTTYWVDPLLGDHREATPGTTALLFVFHEVLLDTVDGSLNHVPGEVMVPDNNSPAYRPAPVTWESNVGGRTWIWGRYQDFEMGIRASQAQDDTTFLIDMHGNTRRDLTPGTTALKFVFGDLTADNAAPVTSLALSGATGDNGWFVGDVTATITAADLPDPGGSGVAAIDTSLEGGPAQIQPIDPPTQTATATLTVAQEGAHVIEAWATDAAGNVGAKVSAGLKLDKTAPQTLLLPDRPPDQDGTYTGPVTVTLAAGDAVSGVAWTKYSLDGGGTWLSYSRPFTLDQAGTHQVQAESRDQAGNEESPPATLELVLVLAGNRPPVADAGEDRAVEATGVHGARVTLDGSGSSDPDGDALTYRWTWTRGRGLTKAAKGVRPTIFLPLGETVVTLVVSDGQADSPPDTVKTAVADKTPPSVRGLTAIPNKLWPANNKMRDVTLCYAVADAISPCPKVQVVVTCNEPSFRASDAQVLDHRHLRLRATRDGQSKAGRIYTIPVRATDAAGNAGKAHTTVTVPHDQR